MADSGAGGGSIQGAPAPSKGRKSKGKRKGGNSRGSRKSSGRGSGGGFDDPRPDRPSMLDLRTIYEGAAGKRTNRMLWKTTLVITNRCVEIEREGANAILIFLSGFKEIQTLHEALLATKEYATEPQRSWVLPLHSSPTLTPTPYPNPNPTLTPRCCRCTRAFHRRSRGASSTGRRRACARWC